MKDKNTIINEIVGNAADVMAAKLDFNECVAEQMERKGNTDVASRLRAQNARIADAVALMREFGGCWA